MRWTVINLADLTWRGHSVAQELAQEATMIGSTKSADYGRGTRQTKRKAGTEAPLQLSIDDIQCAVRRLLELAAAYEGRGPKISRSGSAGYSRDMRALRDAVKLLRRNADDANRDQRDVVLSELCDLTSSVYRKSTDWPAAEVQEAVVEKFDTTLFCLRDEDLDELVKLRSGENGSIGELGGPSEAAKDAVAKVARFSQGTIGNARRRARALTFMRTTFGRWITTDALQEYVRDLFRTHIEAVDTQILSLGDLKEFALGTGAALDRWHERGFRELATYDGIKALIVSTSKSPLRDVVCRRIQKRVDARWKLYVAMSRRFPELLKAEFEEPSELRRALDALILAREADNDDALIAAGRKLRLALVREAVAEAADDLGRLLGFHAGGSDSAPTCPGDDVQERPSTEVA